MSYLRPAWTIETGAPFIPSPTAKSWTGFPPEARPAYGEITRTMANSIRPALTGALLVLAAGSSAMADTAAEKEKLAQCAKDICGVIVSKKAAGPDVACTLAKTWEKEQVQKAADYMSYSWGLGSAACTANLNLKRADLVAALTSHEYTFKFGKQHISCEIGEAKYAIRATVAPELKFKDGAAKSGKMQMSDIEGAALIKGVVWTAAALERNFGLFDSDLIRETNRFMQSECPKLIDSAEPKNTEALKTETHK
jgi:hypothetical protein